MWAYQKSEGIGKSAWYLYSREHNVIEKGPAFLEQKDNFLCIIQPAFRSREPWEWGYFSDTISWNVWYLKVEPVTLSMLTAGRK